MRSLTDAAAADSNESHAEHASPTNEIATFVISAKAELLAMLRAVPPTSMWLIVALAF
jgi:hypothetical protein